MQVRILGTLEVLDDSGRPVAVVGPRQRAALALLALRAGHVIPADDLVDALWGEEPPANAANALQTVVSRLRRALGERALETRPPGYVLRAEPDDVDAVRFERLADEGRRALAAGDAGRAGDRLREALALCQGDPLAEFSGLEFARREAGRLRDRRLAALEDRIDADLAGGRHADVEAEIEALAAAHPTRERLQAQRILALYRAGRQADALAAYRDVATLLLDEYGIEPGRALRDLERQMLQQDPALDPPVVQASPRAEAPPVARPREAVAERRVVSVACVELGELDGERRSRVAEGRARAAARRGPGGARAPRRRGRAAGRRRAARGVRARAGPRGRRCPGRAGRRCRGRRGRDRHGRRRHRRAPGRRRLGRRRAGGAGRPAARGSRPRPARSLVDADTVALAPHAAALRRGRERLPAGRAAGRAPAGPPARHGRRSSTAPPSSAPSGPRSTAPSSSGGRRWSPCSARRGSASRGWCASWRGSLGGDTIVAVGRCLSYGASTSAFALDEVVRALVGDDLERGPRRRCSADEERGEQIAARVAAAIDAGGQGGPGEEVQWAFRRLLERVARSTSWWSGSTTCTGPSRGSSTWSSTSRRSPASRC